MVEVGILPVGPLLEPEPTKMDAMVSLSQSSRSVGWSKEGAVLTSFVRMSTCSAGVSQGWISQTWSGIVGSISRSEDWYNSPGCFGRINNERPLSSDSAGDHVEGSCGNLLFAAVNPS